MSIDHQCETCGASYNERESERGHPHVCKTEDLIARIEELESRARGAGRALIAPSEDPDTRPLVDRCQTDSQLVIDLMVWVAPVLRDVEDDDLRVRCMLLLGMASARIRRPEGAR